LVVSSEAIRSDRRKRRSLSLISNGLPFGGSAGRLGPAPRLRLKSHLRFQRHVHLVARGTRPLTAGFDLRIAGHSVCDRIGQFPGKPVDGLFHVLQLPWG
jgi:hypothetical protein